jgi:hypothetical protein
MLAWFAYTDQNGKDFILGPIKFPPGYDLTNEAQTRLPQARQEARQLEANRLLSEIISGKDSLSVAQGVLTHLSQDQAVRVILKQAMAEEDPIGMLRIQSLMTYLNANYPGDLLASYLGVATSRTTALRNRYSAVIAADINSLRASDQWP